MVFAKARRAAMDAARVLGKRVRVIIEGADVFLDRKVVEMLTDPLIHLARNAVDHGIEPPDERVRLGKPAEGVVRLVAQRDGMYVRIAVEDDGRG